MKMICLALLWTVLAGMVHAEPCVTRELRPVPSPALMRRFNEGVDVIGIVHWGLNTYTDREWGFGDEDPNLLNPKSFDAEQIVGACAAGGLQGLVVVAKHHDGFCLWPTKTTGHNISKSPFRGGKGDYVREMERACRKFGLKFGVYVSPWDRNSAHYGTERYVELYHAQIKELLSGDYGEVFEMWFDGANGGDGWYGGSRETRRISAGYYRFGEIFSFVRALQPSVTIFAGEQDAGDFRWPGNERGILDPDSRATIDTVGGFVNGEYGNPNYAYHINTGIPTGQFFRACEADFPMRKGWFYHAKDDGHSKHAAYLMQRYLGTVGNGGTMNIGVSPTRDGVLSAEDVRTLADFGKIRKAFFANEVTESGRPYNVVVLSEDVSRGEQVDHWFLWGDKNETGGRDYLAEGRAVGSRRIRLLPTLRSDRDFDLQVTSAGPDLKTVALKRYHVAEELLKVIREATTDSGETDTAKWMTGNRSAVRSQALDIDFLFKDEERADKDSVSDYDCLSFESDGSEIYGQILKPDGSYGADRPCVLMFHGFAGFATLDDIGHALCRAGCVVVIPHHRGAWGSQGKYLVSNCIQDAVNLVRHVRGSSFVRKYSTSPDAVFLVGHSMGGNTVLNAAGRVEGVRGVVMLDPCDIGSMALRVTPSEMRRFLSENGLSVLRTDGVDALLGDVAEHAREFAFPNSVSRLNGVSLFLADATWGLDKGDSLMSGLQAAAQRNKGITHYRRCTYPGKHGLMGRRVQLTKDIADFIRQAL